MFFFINYGNKLARNDQITVPGQLSRNKSTPSCKGIDYSKSMTDKLWNYIYALGTLWTFIALEYIKL